MQCNATIGSPHASANRQPRVDGDGGLDGRRPTRVGVCADGGVRFAVRRRCPLACNASAPLSASASEHEEAAFSWTSGKDHNVMSCMQHTFSRCCYLWLLPAHGHEYCELMHTKCALVSASMRRASKPDGTLH